MFRFFHADSDEKGALIKLELVVHRDGGRVRAEFLTSLSSGGSAWWRRFVVRLNFGVRLSRTTDECHYKADRDLNLVLLPRERQRIHKTPGGEQQCGY